MKTIPLRVLVMSEEEYVDLREVVYGFFHSEMACNGSLFPLADTVWAMVRNKVIVTHVEQVKENEK